MHNNWNKASFSTNNLKFYNKKERHEMRRTLPHLPNSTQLK